MTRYHYHHRWPQHAIGPPPKENLIKCTIAEHADFHRIEYEKWGRKEDYLAWMGLLGLIDKAEIARQLLVESNKKRKGIKHTPEVIAKRKHAMKGIAKSPEHRKKLSIANLGKKQDPDMVNQRAEKQRGQKRNIEFCLQNAERMKGNCYAKDSKRSEESKKRYSESAKERWKKRKAEAPEAVAVQ